MLLLNELYELESAELGV